MMRMLVEAALQLVDGYNVCVAFWDHAANEMKQKATSFFSLNKYLQHLKR